jgi:hypothetical protein
MGYPYHRGFPREIVRGAEVLIRLAEAGSYSCCRCLEASLAVREKTFDSRAPPQPSKLT